MLRGWMRMVRCRSLELAMGNEESSKSEAIFRCRYAKLLSLTLYIKDSK